MNQFFSFMQILKSLQTTDISHKKPQKNKKTSPDINHPLKPYIESAYISPNPASPPHSI